MDVCGSFITSEYRTAILFLQNLLRRSVITADVEKMTEEANSEVSEEREAKKIGELASVRRQRQRQESPITSLSRAFLCGMMLNAVVCILVQSRKKHNPRHSIP